MTLLSRAKAMPLPEHVAYLYHDGPTREQIPGPLLGTIAVRLTEEPHYRNETKLITEDALRTAREQIAAEGDEVIGRLCRVVDAHVSDLRECIPTLKGFGLSATAAEVAKACDELSAAIAEARKA